MHYYLFTPYFFGPPGASIFIAELCRLRRYEQRCELSRGEYESVYRDLFHAVAPPWPIKATEFSEFSEFSEREFNRCLVTRKRYIGAFEYQRRGVCNLSLTCSTEVDAATDVSVYRDT